jgi:hypothetical protein
VSIVERNRKIAISCRNTLEDCQNLAKRHNGKFLSKEYINNKTKYEWECEIGHRWLTKYNNVCSGKWCPRCAIVSIEDCKKKAQLKNGKCLSLNYVPNKKMKWQCEKGHIWETTFYIIQKGCWCPECSGVKRKTIKDCHEQAKKHNGKCLSNTFINVRAKYKWKCEKGHIWTAIYNNINAGKWCPECSYLNAAKKRNDSYVEKHWQTSEDLVCVGSWEKRTVDFLNRNKTQYKWQPQTFQIEELQTTYRPDLYLIEEDKWVEIKGRFYEDAKQKWDWFHREYPNSELWNHSKLIELGIL